MERPVEWLRYLDETEDGYARLISESGSLAVAAYRLARARCRIYDVKSAPTARELTAAASVLARRVPGCEQPSRAVLTSELCASDCEVLTELPGGATGPSRKTG